MTGAFLLFGGSVAAGVLNVLALRAERPSETALLLRLIRRDAAVIGVGVGRSRSCSGSGSCTSGASRSAASGSGPRSSSGLVASALGGARRASTRSARVSSPSGSRRRATRRPTSCARSSATRGQRDLVRLAGLATLAAPRPHDLEAGRVMLAYSRPFWPLFLHVLGAMVLFGACWPSLLLASPRWRRPDAPCSPAPRSGAARVALPAWVVMRVCAQWIYSKEFGQRPRPDVDRIGFLAADLGLLLLLVTTAFAFWWKRTGNRWPGVSSPASRTFTSCSWRRALGDGRKVDRIMVSMNRLTTEKRAAGHRLPGRGQLDPRDRPHDRRSEEHGHEAAGRLGRACRVHRTTRCATCRASGPGATRSGRSATRRRRTSPDEKRGDGYGDVWTWVAHRRRHEAGPVLARRRARPARAHRLHARPRRPARQPRPAHHRRPPRSTSRRRASVRRRRRLRAADQDLRQRATTKPAQRYRPAMCIGADANRVSGDPDPAQISHQLRRAAEPHHADGMRRFTRLTNGFSKKVENLAAAVSAALRLLQLLPRPQDARTTPAVAAGIADHVWTLRELIALLEEAENVPIKRGSYQKLRECQPQRDFSLTHYPEPGSNKSFTARRENPRKRGIGSPR